MVNIDLMAIKIEHDRPNCIGCAACAGVSPDHWEMNADGKSDVIGGTKRDDEWEEKDLSDAEYDANMQAAQSCPVNVIHLVKKETGERII